MDSLHVLISTCMYCVGQRTEVFCLSMHTCCGMWGPSGVNLIYIRRLHVAKGHSAYRVEREKTSLATDTLSYMANFHSVCLGNGHRGRVLFSSAHAPQGPEGGKRKLAASESWAATHMVHINQEQSCRYTGCRGTTMGQSPRRLCRIAIAMDVIFLFQSCIAKD